MTRLLLVAAGLTAALSVRTPSLAAAQIKPRLIIGFDTSGSMALDLGGVPTFGDGVRTGCSDVGAGVLCGEGCTAGIDTDCDGEPNDSRMFIAKQALRNMVYAFGDVEFALARFGQTQALGESCIRIDDQECLVLPGPAFSITSYGNPQCNTGDALPITVPRMGRSDGYCPWDFASALPAACRPGARGNPALRVFGARSPEVCINYGGGCGLGGDFLVTFPGVGAFAGAENADALVRWIDNAETDPRLGAVSSGNYCDHRGGGDCELRPEGTTPLAGILESIGSAVAPVVSADRASACRPYSVILLTDGVETCSGDPEGAARSLRGMGIETYVIGFAVGAGAESTLNAIATAGGTDAGESGGNAAFFADDPNELSAGLAEIVRRSLLIETCNNLDDDCDGATDEGFRKWCNEDAGITAATLCADPGDDCDGDDDNCFLGTSDEPTNRCGSCGPVPLEVCDGADNNCNGIIDEGGVCDGCVPVAEICDGADNDCDGRIDEGVERACGTDVGRCTRGIEICREGTFGPCSGVAAAPETCNGLDDDCDGVIDGNTRPCGTEVGQCNPGIERCVAGAFGETCEGAVGTAPEICDGLDNDCDGRTDEDVADIGSCGSSLGVCTPGTLRCVAGTFVCEGAAAPVAESCNALDDDCDGVTDEGLRGGACGESRGECRAGARLCLDGAFACVGPRGPTGELCDGLDNDCDGRTDEGNPGGGVACGTEAGTCAPGRTECRGGALVCAGGSGGEAERCNLIDDDCDGLIDEGNPDGGGRCGASDVGACERGAEACVEGMLICRGGRGLRDELCDGVDNDCDGRVDEGDPEAGAPCGDDTGECRAGTTRCEDGALTCAGGSGPTAEICDGLDNDCDGVEDEGISVGAPCGTDAGECVPGVNVCRDGMLACEGGVGAIEELCDNVDNDCDGVIDEAIPPGGSCGSVEGLCMEGSLQCIDGRSICVGEVPPSREACDCEDNDCDGAIDEAPELGSLCPGGSACIECACSLPCARTEFGNTCPSGKTPLEEDGACFCVTPRCDPEACAEETQTRADEVLCTPEGAASPCVCRNNACTFACDGVVCAEGTVCDPRNGRCAEDSCRGLGCPEGRMCDPATGVCGEDPCADVECAGQEACVMGMCTPTCARVECESAEVCRAGRCVADLCAGVVCPRLQVCDPESGACVEDRCIDVRCPAETICNPLSGECERDPCTLIRCPEMQRCEAGECVGILMAPDAGAGVPDAGASPEVPGKRVLATGGGGCACRAGGAATTRPWPLGLGMGLLLLLLVRRRRRRVRRTPALAGTLRGSLAGLVLLATLASGCDVDPFCLDCFDGAPAQGVDGGAASRDAGPRPNIKRPDVGVDAAADACLAEERCNERDDDCDGEVDEGIDTDSDGENCGACGARCAPVHAFGVCREGDCEIDTCDVGWFDLDGERDNGCEYRCLPEAEDDTVCDLRDNDCDGDVDEDVALATDPRNCGSCGRICRFAHVISPRCAGAVCTFDRARDCEEGFFDVNEVAADGCEYACTPADHAIERCNARDDDCDGRVDEGDPDGGAACGSAEGLCTRGTLRCREGALACEGEIAPATESCDGADNDCDGIVDEGNPEGGRLCGESVGTCERGRETCMGGALVCMGGATATEERCDGLDNDCDGIIDESDPEGGAACGESAGACRAGRSTCRGGSLICVGGAGPGAERCNGSDDDCDGRVDEGRVDGAGPEAGGACGTDVGACTPGTEVCREGRLVCTGATAGGEERCNAIDDDCDGRVDEGDPEGGARCGSATGACRQGTETCAGGSLVCRGGVGARAERCNEVDDDCDAETDENTDLQNDVNNCGGCGRRCDFPGAIAGCARGACVLLGCEGGFADANGDPADGCEYACSVRGAEICNGEDDDCDARTDEGLTPPATFCNANGVCRGTRAICGGAAGWQCAYPPTFEESEGRCDGADNDCDGRVDEGFADLGNACSNGAGACRRSGVFVCGGSGRATVCGAPPAGEGSREICNAIDDDCDGRVDEDVGQTIPVVTLPRSGIGSVAMMVYEASRPDATALSSGAVSTLACSRAGVLPWVNVTWDEANGACAALGARWGLCEEADWQRACEGAAGSCLWSYATSCGALGASNDLLCNGDEVDASPAAGDQDALEATGSFAQCYADWASGGIYDLSGNAKEWTATERGDPSVHAIRGGSYNNIEAGRRCDFDFTVGDANFSFVNTGFRCCRY